MEKSNKNDIRASSVRRSEGMRSSNLSLYERIIEQNSSKPNVHIFVEMDNKFEPIKRTQTEKFDC